MGTKKMKVTRRIFDRSGGATTAEKVLQIDVKPGWKAGTKITFREEGDERPGTIPADIVFVLGEKPHATFQRDGNNLVLKQTVSLKDALCGEHVIRTETLDGRRLEIPVTEVITPDMRKIVRGEGMPISKQPGQKGDLIVQFTMRFPSTL